MASTLSLYDKCWHFCVSFNIQKQSEILEFKIQICMSNKYGFMASCYLRRLLIAIIRMKGVNSTRISPEIQSLNGTPHFQNKYTAIPLALIFWSFLNDDIYSSILCVCASLKSVIIVFCPSDAKILPWFEFLVLIFLTPFRLNDIKCCYQWKAARVGRNLVIDKSLPPIDIDT